MMRPAQRRVQPTNRSASGMRSGLCALLFAVCSAAPLHSQSYPTPPPSTTEADRLAAMDRRLSEVTAALDQTQKTLEQSLQEIQRLRAELDRLNAERAQMQPATTQPALATETPATATPATTSSSTATGLATKEEVNTLREQQEVLQAQVKQLDQTKVETASKYRLRVSGLALFNAFSNIGVVDSVTLPTLALPRFAGGSHGSLGATLQQSVLGFDATGPMLANAHTSAHISVDFFGGVSTNAYGYTSAAGVLRMREIEINLDWPNTLLQAGYTSPLISPLNPSSYATVAEPSLSGSGNLWVWSPQVRIEQRIPISGQRGIAIEGGLISPQSAGYSAIQFDSSVEASRRPGIEGRVSYRSDLSGLHTDRPLILGVGGYVASQFYKNTTHVRSWAFTADWQIPLSHWFDISGELYRGSALGGLGGGLYKDVLIGTDSITGAARTAPVNAAGGWAQLKTRFSSTLEANAIFGMDNAFSDSFENLILPSTSGIQTYAARSSTVVGNVIFRPKSYLILSPEYRRLISWPYNGNRNIANIFTISVGYQF